MLEDGHPWGRRERRRPSGILDDDRVDLRGLSGYEPDDRPFWHEFGLRRPAARCRGDQRAPARSSCRRRPNAIAGYPASRGPASSATTRSCACPCCSAATCSAGSRPPTRRRRTSARTTSCSCDRSASSARRRSTARVRARARRPGAVQARCARGRVPGARELARARRDVRDDHASGRAALSGRWRPHRARRSRPRGARRCRRRGGVGSRAARRWTCPSPRRRSSPATPQCRVQ